MGVLDLAEPGYVAGAVALVVALLTGLYLLLSRESGPVVPAAAVPAATAPTRVARPRKLDFAVAAASHLIRHLHLEGGDRGMICSFGDTFRVEQGFTAAEGALQAALARIHTRRLDGSTRLYDSIADAIANFWQGGDRDRPWVLVVLTDGIDNASRAFRNDPARLGRLVAERFNHEPSNFPFLVAVGEGEQINPDALAEVGRNGRFPVLRVRAFGLLEAFFLRIALHVAEGVVGRVTRQGDRTWAEVARIRRLSRRKIDYCILIDRSQSMGAPA